MFSKTWNPDELRWNHVFLLNILMPVRIRFCLNVCKILINLKKFVELQKLWFTLYKTFTFTIEWNISLYAFQKNSFGKTVNITTTLKCENNTEIFLNSVFTHRYDCLHLNVVGRISGNTSPQQILKPLLLGRICVLIKLLSII